LSTAHPIAVTYAPIHAHKGDFLGDKQKPPTQWKYYHHRDRGFASTTARIEPTEGRGGEKRAKKNSSSTTHPTAAALACNKYQQRGIFGMKQCHMMEVYHTQDDTASTNRSEPTEGREDTAHPTPSTLA